MEVFGVPLLNDVRYGAERVDGMEGLGLFCAGLEFDHPVKGNGRVKVEVEVGGEGWPEWAEGGAAFASVGEAGEADQVDN